MECYARIIPRRAAAHRWGKPYASSEESRHGWPTRAGSLHAFLTPFLGLKMPDGLKEASLEMMVGVKECAFALGKCVNQLAEKPEEASKAAAIESG